MVVWFFPFKFLDSIFSGFYMQKIRKKLLNCKTLAKISTFINKHTRKNNASHKRRLTAEVAVNQKKSQES